MDGCMSECYRSLKNSDRYSGSVRWLQISCNTMQYRTNGTKMGIVCAIISFMLCSIRRVMQKSMQCIVVITVIIVATSNQFYSIHDFHVHAAPSSSSSFSTALVSTSALALASILTHFIHGFFSYCTYFLCALLCYCSCSCS